MAGGDRERGRHRLLRGDAGADELVDVVERVERQRPLNPARDIGTGDVPRKPGAARRGLNAHRQRRVHAHAVQPSGHGGGDRRRAGDRDARAVRQAAGLSDPLQQRLQGRTRRSDPDRGDPHRGAVGVSPAAGVLHVARREALERPARRRAEQVERAGGEHPLLPRHQRESERALVDDPAAVDQRAGDDHGLVGVVRDPARGQPGADLVLVRPRLEAGQAAVARGDALAREQLRRHPERVADRQPVERAEGAVLDRHPRDDRSAARFRRLDLAQPARQDRLEPRRVIG